MGLDISGSLILLGEIVKEGRCENESSTWRHKGSLNCSIALWLRRIIMWHGSRWVYCDITSHPDSWTDVLDAVFLYVPGKLWLNRKLRARSVKVESEIMRADHVALCWLEVLNPPLYGFHEFMFSRYCAVPMRQDLVLASKLLRFLVTELHCHDGIWNSSLLLCSS